MQMSALGGTLCSIWASINLGDIFQTVLMAVLGTLVSFGMSKLLRRDKDSFKK